MTTITTTLIAPGERAVKVDGEYVGLITREPEGWMWTGDRTPFRTFTLAAERVATKHAKVPSPEMPTVADLRPDAVTATTHNVDATAVTIGNVLYSHDGGAYVVDAVTRGPDDVTLHLHDTLTGSDLTDVIEPDSEVILYATGDVDAFHAMRARAVSEPHNVPALYAGYVATQVAA